MKRKPVSEGYLIFQRSVTFLDEWLFYGLLLFLYLNQHFLMLTLVAPIGGFFIWNSYKRQWAMEKKRFGDIHSGEDRPMKVASED